MTTAALILIGLTAGVASGLLGIGGGLIIVPGLLFFTHCSMHQAVGTSLAIIIPTAFVGTFMHHQFGNVLWGSALLLTLGAVVGSFFGSRLAESIPAGLLQKGFAIFLLFVALRMFFK